MQSFTRYNRLIPQMRARAFSGLRLAWLSFLLAFVSLTQSLNASNLEDTARQLARKIASDAGPGTFTIELTNRSSLDEKSENAVRSALEGELHAQGIQGAKPDQSMGAITVVLSESLREYVWTAEIAVGSDEKKVAFVSLPRPPTATMLAVALPITLKATSLFAQEQPIQDVAFVETSSGARLLVLSSTAVTLYHRQSQSVDASGHWEFETSLPIAHSRVFPRDLRGRLLLRRDHLFDVYLPGVFCHSSFNAALPPTLTCNDSDDPWPLSADDNAARAFFAPSRNFFTGALSPGIGKIFNIPAFYSAAALPHSGYTLWAIAAVDGSLHFIDGMADQLVRSAKFGSELASIHSACGAGTQLLMSESGNPSGKLERDGMRAFEVPDRDPVPVSSTLEFDGRIVALWDESGANRQVAIVKQNGTGWYEAYRISISCGS
jgi:hypothetical protein